jgi:hypothetical protein
MQGTRRIMPEMSFQAVIWFDEQSGRFRVQIRPYHGQGALTYVAMMDAEKLGEFIVLIGVDPDVFSTISTQKALVLEGVEVDEASDLAGFEFTQEKGAAH